MRLKSLLLVCVMLLFSAIPALAVGPTLDLGTVSSNPGQTVTVIATLTGGTNTIGAIAMDIEYDPTVLSNPIGDTATGTVKWAVNEVAVSSSIYRIGLTRAQKNPATNLPYGIPDGQVFSVTFTVANGASGAITLKNTPSGGDIAKGDPVILTGANGIINLPVILPSISSFTIPATGSSLDVTFSTLTASANTVAYLITESSTTPSASDTNWKTTKPTSYTFTTFGTKTLRAWAKEKDGNLSTAAVTATTTLTEPAATVTAFTIPATGFSLTIPITTFTASSNAVAYLINESATPPAASAITSAIPASPTSAAPFGPVTGFGAHTLYAWVKNVSGAVSAAASATITLSAEPTPVLTVSTLADKAYTNNNTLNITGSATKNPAADATSGVIAGVTVNGTAVTLNLDGTFSTAITLTEGSNTITVVASDSKTPVAVTSNDVRTITYDITAPTLTVTAPANNSQTKVAGVTITGTVNETSTVDISQNGGAIQHATMNGTSFSLPVTLVEGANTFTLTATDQATNASSATPLNIKLDTVKPELAITDPTADITTTYATYLVKGTTSDANGITLDFKVDGVSVTPAPAITAGAFEQTVTLTSAATTTHAVSVTVSDEAGNASTVQRNIIFRKLSVEDALKALRISVGLVTQTADDLVLDVAPLLSGKPHGDTVVDAGDAVVILRRIVGLVTW